jgi:hypothetical protein
VFDRANLNFLSALLTSFGVFLACSGDFLMAAWT